MSSFKLNPNNVFLNLQKNNIIKHHRFICGRYGHRWGKRIH